MTSWRFFPFPSVRFSAAGAMGAGAGAVKRAGEDDNKKEMLTDHKTAPPTRQHQQHLPIPEGREKRFDKTKHSTPDFRHVVVTEEMQKKRSVWQVPVAPFGIAATIIALLYMFRSSYKGDRNSLMLSMQYRIIAQFFTVVSLVVGTWYLQFKASRDNEN